MVATIATSDPRASEVRVIGNNPMQNELLVSFIKAETGLECSYCDTSDLSSKDNRNDLADGLAGESHRPVLFLLDAQNADLYFLLSCLDTGTTSIQEKCFFAAYNLEPDMKFCMDALCHGFHGVFFNNEPVRNITKGIQAILSGDFWYSRKILSQYLAAERSIPRLRGEMSSQLTLREKEVLLKIHSGTSNQEIADDLCISFHTVKTHVYNIFRKIQVTSRFQARLWADRFLVKNL